MLNSNYFWEEIFEKYIYVTFIKEQIDDHDTYRNKNYFGESNGRLNFHRYICFVCSRLCKSHLT